jgi:hypothetical protein
MPADCHCPRRFFVPARPSGFSGWAFLHPTTSSEHPSITLVISLKSLPEPVCPASAHTVLLHSTRCLDPLQSVPHCAALFCLETMQPKWTNSRWPAEMAPRRWTVFEAPTCGCHRIFAKKTAARGSPPAAIGFDFQPYLLSACKPVLQNLRYKNLLTAQRLRPLEAVAARRSLDRHPPCPVDLPGAEARPDRLR